MDDTISTLLLLPSPFPAEIMASLRAISPRLCLQQQAAKAAADVGQTWAEVEVLYTTSILPAPDDAPCLRWVHCHWAGVDELLESHRTLLQKVAFTTSSGIHAAPIAEYVLMMMLAWRHNLPKMVRHQMFATWPPHRWQQFSARELRGSTLGIVGYGSLGREIARLAQAFGLRVLATKRDVDDRADRGWQPPHTGDADGQCVERFYAPQELKAMAALCDFLVLAVPLTVQTRGLIGPEILQAMKRDAVLINVARGAVVDEPALVQALQAGTIGGAVLDVFVQEPLPAESPLWRLPNVILSPHVAGLTLEYNERAVALFAENLRRYVAGQPLLNVVNIERGY